MFEIKMPQLGQSVEEATIVRWLKQEGDAVNQGDPLCAVQTDKAELEVESTASGVLRKILFPSDASVPVLTVIALVGDANEALPGGASTVAAPKAQVPAAATAPVATAEAPAPIPAPASATPAAVTHDDAGRPFVSPRARAKAKELGVDPAAIQGSGPEGRVIEADVLASAGSGALRATPVARRLAADQGISLSSIEGTGPHGKIMRDDVTRAASAPAATPAAAPKAIAPAQAPAAGPLPAGKRIPLSNMRKVIARRMSESKYTAPHYYVTVEIDLSSAIKRFRSGGLSFKPSFNDLVLAAAVKGLREFPAVNATWAGDAIIEAADINLGVAVALPTGLIVPVIRQAQHLSMEGLHEAAKTLTDKARAGKLLPDEYSGNTFTVSNLGAYGVDHFTAIINQPDSAILAVGQIKDRPVVVDGGIHIRPIMKMTLSSDHRVIDGAIAAQFMGRVKEILESADL